MVQVGLFLAFIFLFDPVASDLESKLPPRWNGAPSDLSEYPQSKEAVLINPWIYEQRQGLVKILLNKTYNKDLFGEDNSGNPLWGLALQLGWQFSSGRLSNSSIETCAISPYSWWGGMNYYLSVLPFFGALKTGLVETNQRMEIVAQPRMNSDLFCYDLDDCESKAGEALAKWAEYFEKLKTENDKEKNLKRLWQAHVASLKVASPLMRRLADDLSTMEKRFGLNWAHFVEYVAAAAINADINTTYDFQVHFLPNVVLNRETMSTLPRKVRDGLDQLHEIYKMDKDGNTVLNIWRSCMCSKVARQYAACVMAKDINQGVMAMLGGAAQLGWICMTESCDTD